MATLALKHLLNQIFNKNIRQLVSTWCARGDIYSRVKNIKGNIVLHKNIIVRTLVAKMSLFLKLSSSKRLPWIPRVKVKQTYPAVLLEVTVHGSFNLILWELHSDDWLTAGERQSGDSWLYTGRPPNQFLASTCAPKPTALLARCWCEDWSSGLPALLRWP